MPCALTGNNGNLRATMRERATKVNMSYYLRLRLSIGILYVREVLSASCCKKVYKTSWTYSTRVMYPDTDLNLGVSGFFFSILIWVLNISGSFFHEVWIRIRIFSDSDTDPVNLDHPDPRQSRIEHITHWIIYIHLHIQTDRLICSTNMHAHHSGAYSK